MLRVHRVPFSTNVERVAIAASHKGVEVDWVDHPDADRSAIAALSGQELVPVAEFPDGAIVADSPVILARMDELWPAPPLWPAAGSVERRQIDGFVPWFNDTWKVPPNLLSERPGSPHAPAWIAQIEITPRYFDALLADRDFLFGDELGIADVIAFPFLRMALGVDAGDDQAFHHLLHRHLPLDGCERLRGWLERLSALPRA